MKTHQSKIEKLIAELCPNGVEWKTLGEVAEIGTGSSNANEAVENGKYPLFVRSKFVKSINTFEFDEEAILIPGEGGVGDIFHYINGKYALHQRAYRIHFSSKEINTKFVYFYLFANFKSFITRYAVNATVSSIRKPMIKKFKIPIPPLPIQKEIVRILDKFTELIAELTTELTNELTARKKQYSYYRDKLLTFEEGEVEHLPMGQEGVGEFIRGSSLQKKDFTETGVGCIHYGQIYTHYGTYAEKTKTFVSENLAKKSRKAQSGDLVIATTSENDEDVCKAVAWLGNEDICVSSDACIYRHNLEAKYVSYFFQTEQFQKQKRQYITGTKVRRVNANNLAKILIPVPSPAEQARIVSILDKFDTLTHSISEGLPREIALRQKQYEYYREKLLNFPQFPSSGGVAGEA